MAKVVTSMDKYRLVGLVALNTLVAFYLVEALVPLLMKFTGWVIPTQFWPGESTLARVVLFRCINTAICAFAVGFVTSRFLGVSAAKWVWVLSALWLVVGIVLFVAEPSESVITREGILRHFFSLGLESASGQRWIRDFSRYTLPTISGVMYSLGAYSFQAIFTPKLHLLSERLD